MDISITTSKCYNKKEGKINVKKGTTMTKTVQKSKARDMTQGSIWKQLLLFSLPLMAGNLFQQLYNTVDSIVVGNFVGKEALAAVGSVGPIINSLIGFFMGLSTGAGVIISQYYGAKADEKVSRTVSTTLVMTFFLSIVFTILGIFITPYMLRMMSTPNDVIRESATYLKIYFGGVAGLMFYNMGSGVLRAVGDSRHPLYFLIFSAVINTVLDLLFVGVLKLGVGSAALATIISQFISALLCLRRLLRSPEEYRLVPSRIRFDPIMLKQIISNGLPAGLQNSIIALANVVVQSNINSFGKMAVAGCGAYSKVEGFGFLPITCFSLALTTFISQNLGAKQYDRAKRGARFGILCSITLAEIVGICVYFLSPYLIAAFNSDPEVVAYGTLQAHTITLFYFLLAFSHCIAGIMRGAGKATVPMFVMLCCWCIIRVTYITIAVRIFPVINTIFWAYPLTWTLSSILFFLYYRKADWIHGFEKK